MKENVLLVFLKYPEEGKAKTRLSVEIGNKLAIDIYKEFIDIILVKTASDDYERVIFIEPSEKKDAFRSLLKKDIVMYGQDGADLGSKQLNAFKMVFDKGAKKVVIIGTDNPLIDHNKIKDAFSLLERYRCVFGPSEDGGYYLLGMDCLKEELFRGISWSTDVVLKQSIEKLKENDVSFAFLDQGFDIDNKEDLFRLKDKMDKEGVLNGIEYDKLRHSINLVLKK